MCAVTTILYLLQYTDLSEAEKKLAMVFLKTEVEKLKNYDNATEAAMGNNNCSGVKEQKKDVYVPETKRRGRL